jgi:5-oxoprolinase (ATP-hydrolysing)
MVKSTANNKWEHYRSAFKEQFRQQYGFDLAGRDLLVDDLRVRGVGRTDLLRTELIPKAEDPSRPPVADRTRMWVSSSHSTSGGGSSSSSYYDDHVPVFLLKDLRFGHVVPGPAIIMYV